MKPKLVKIKFLSGVLLSGIHCDGYAVFFITKLPPEIKHIIRVSEEKQISIEGQDFKVKSCEVTDSPDGKMEFYAIEIQAL